MFIRWLTRLSPSRVIIFSSAITVIIGIILLSLPISHVTSVSFMDTLFVTISAITSTGLHTVDLFDFSFFGHCIIATLMQVGALGIIILTLLILHLFFGLHKPTKKVTAELLGIRRKTSIHTRRMLLVVVILTLTIELVCALIMFVRLSKDFSMGHAFFLSIFHSISAFSNTGFTLFKNSMEPYNGSYIMLSTLSVLMLTGAIGFTTLKEGVRYLASLPGKIRYRFSLGSRIVVRTTFVLLFVSFLLCLVLEYNHAFANMTPIQSMLNALFYVISSMGTGMQTVTSSATKVATMLLIMVIAFIGGSPGSTGSGIRTTTVAIFVAAFRSVVRGKEHVILRGRRIDVEQVTKAIAMITLSIPFIILMTFLLLVSEPNFTLLDSVFETVSGFANLGMSTGVTPDLSIIGKILICITMLIGRLGPFTLIFALRPRTEQGDKTPSKKEKVKLV